MRDGEIQMTHSRQRPPDTPRVFRDETGQWHYLDRINGVVVGLLWEGPTMAELRDNAAVRV